MTLPSWKQVSREVIHKNPWWEYGKYCFERPDGKVIDYYHAKTNGASYIVPIRSDGKIALVRFYRCLFDRMSVEFIGGGIKEGQTPLDAAKDELREESGLDSLEWSEVGRFGANSGLLLEYGYVFVASNVEETLHIEHGENEPFEIEEIFFAAPDEIDNMIREGEMWEATAITSWSLYKQSL